MKRLLQKYVFIKLGRSFYAFIIVFVILPIGIAFVYSFNRYEKIIEDEINSSTIKSILSIEEEINDLLKGTVKISNFIMNDKGLIDVLSDPNKSYYERTIITDELIGNIIGSNIFMDALNITIIDNENQLYTNWSINYNLYNDILEKEWVIKAKELNGFLSWSILEPTFIKKLNFREISLAREIVDLRKNNVDLGVMIISFSEEELMRILKKYISEVDVGMIVDNRTSDILTASRDDQSYQWESIKSNQTILEKLKTGYVVQDYQNDKYLINKYTFQHIDWAFEENSVGIVVFTKFEDVANSISTFANQILVIFLLFIYILLLSAIVLVKWIVNPIKRLSKEVEEFTISNDSKVIELPRDDEIGVLYRQFGLMQNKIRQLFKQAETEHQIREKYRYESLRAQVNPHFLFNTLNMIRCMAIIIKAENIVNSLEALGNLLNFSMNKGSEIVTLRDELKNIESYTFIQNTRFGDRFDMHINIPVELMSYYVVKFILQPVIENSFMHGFKNKKQKYKINISGKIEDNKLILSVEDNGVGISQKKLDALNEDMIKCNERSHKVTGIGLTNIDERIKLSYGNEYGIRIYSGPLKGTTIKYILPIIERSTLDDKDIDC